jgi:hypothetical protein
MNAMTMIAPALAAVRTADESTYHARDLDFPNGDDLALSRGTDFYGLDELLTGPERELRDRVRIWCDTEVSPAAADYWERAEFPVRLVKGYAALGIAGASLSSATAVPACPTLRRA